MVQTAFLINFSSHLQLPVNQGDLNLVSSSDACSSKTKIQSSCCCSKEAGTCSTEFPSTELRTAEALCCPQASKTILCAFRIVLIPVVIAKRGTCAKLGKLAELAIRVSLSKAIRRVVEILLEPGSLNPICPLDPIPNNCKSMPPASSICCS